CDWYLQNGVCRCYVVSVNPKGRENVDIPSLQIPSKLSKETPALVFRPQESVTDSAEDIEVEVTPEIGDSLPEGTFTLRVFLEGVETETYPRVGLRKSDGVASVVEVVKPKSKLLLVEETADREQLSFDERTLAIPVDGAYAFGTSATTLPALLQGAPTNGALPGPSLTKDLIGDV